MQTYHLLLRYYCWWGGSSGCSSSNRLSSQACGVGTIGRRYFNTWQIDWGRARFRSCSGVKQWMIAGVGEWTRRVMTGRPWFPACLELVMDWGSWRVVWRGRRGQRWMEGHERVQVCKHGFCCRGTVNTTSPRLSHCQERTFIPKTFIRKELVRILRKN